MPPTTVIEDDARRRRRDERRRSTRRRRHRLLREPRGRCASQINDPVVVGPTNSFGEICGRRRQRRRRRRRGRRAAASSSLGAGRLQPGADQLDDESLAEALHAGRRTSATASRRGRRRRSTTTSATSSSSVTAPPAGRRRRPARARRRAAAGRRPALGRDLQRREPGRRRRAGEVRRAGAALIVNNLARAGHRRPWRRSRTTTAPTNDGVVDATLTLERLIAAIQAAGGPRYDFRQIDPVDDQDGGEPGGNIRVGFLFRTDRGLAFVDRPGGRLDDADAVVAGGRPAALYSPGRIDPTNRGVEREPQAARGRVHLQRPARCS